MATLDELAAQFGGIPIQAPQSNDLAMDIVSSSPQPSPSIAPVPQPTEQLQPAPIAPMPQEQPVPSPTTDLDALAAQFGGEALTQEQEEGPGYEGVLESFVEGAKNLPEAVYDTVTGYKKITPEIERLPDWINMPEMQEMTVPGFKAALGTMLTNPEETTKIMKAQFPDIEIRRDKKGNYIMKSKDGNDYAIKPGFRSSDIGRVIFGAVTALPAAGISKLIPGILGEMGTQAVIEGTQMATGGEANAGEVLTAGVLRGGADVLARGARAARGGLTGKVDGAPIEAVQEVGTEEIGKLAQKAGRGSGDAMESLAKEMDIDLVDAKLSEELGFKLPADVFSNSDKAKLAARVSRSVVGSDAEEQFFKGINQAKKRSEDLMAEHGALSSTGDVSENVLMSLKDSRDELLKEKDLIYKGKGGVNEQFPFKTPIEFTETIKAIDDLAEDMGGFDNLKPQIKKLYAKITSGKTSRGFLLDEKDIIGDAVFGKNNDYSASISNNSLKRIYDGLSKDELVAAARISDDLAGKVASGRAAHSQAMKVQQKIKDAFGSDEKGSIGSKLTSMIKGSRSQNVKQFNEIMDLMSDLPKEDVSEAIMTSIMSGSKKANGSFGLKEYTNLYHNLRNNKSFYKRIAKELGKERADLLQGLYKVNKRVSDAEVLMTGKANQAMALDIKKAMKAENIVSWLLDSTAGKVLSSTYLGPVGPVANKLGTSLVSAASTGGEKAIELAGKVFNSDEFIELAINAATKKEIPESLVKKLVNSKRFRAFAKEAKLPKEASELRKMILAAARTKENIEQEENK